MSKVSNEIPLKISAKVVEGLRTADSGQLRLSIEIVEQQRLVRILQASLRK